ncbi:MAG TPA: beta-propeller fold lactonase family protein, partial [Phycisphaerae bacterium]|nr:beta-propeller fold lactonase family protein [Phycisphaerae bacterium]
MIVSFRSGVYFLNKKIAVGVTAGMVALTLHGVALAQSATRAVFVSNNGNLEGSVSSFTVNPDGTLNFVNKVVTGSRPNTSVDCPGCNAYRVAISPNGRYLVTGHPAGNLDGVSILQVASNAAVSLVTQVVLVSGMGGPLDVVWLDNDYVAVTRSESSPNRVVIYQFNSAVPSLTEIRTYDVGSFSVYLAVNAARTHLYVGDTGSGDRIFVFSISTGGILTPVQTYFSTPLYPIGLQVSPDGSKLYAGCGISGSGHNVTGFSLDGSGQVTPLAGSPFTSPGTSPKAIAYSTDSHYLFVGHGTDSTARSFAIDPGTGNLTYTGASFSVGIQGSLGDMTVLDNLLLLTDNFNTPTGVLSFTIAPDGTFTQNGAKFPSNGIAARGLAV